MIEKEMFLGMNYVSAKFLEEAETITELKGDKWRFSPRKPVLIIIWLLLIGCGAGTYLILA